MSDSNFNHIFNSYNINLKKPNKETFLHVLKTIRVKPEECVFIDDEDSNIKVAQEIGIVVIKYRDNQDLGQHLAKMGIL